MVTTGDQAHFPSAFAAAAAFGPDAVTGDDRRSVAVTPSWIISTDTVGDLRLIVDVDPPWPRTVHAAAAVVRHLDECIRSGAEADAEEAAIELEGLIGLLATDNVTARLAS